MVRGIGWVVLSLALAVSLACGGDDDSDGPGGGNADQVLLGSCTEPASSSGHYLCLMSWRVPEDDGLDYAALFRGTCSDPSAYSTGECGGGYKGCCTVQNTEQTQRNVYCFYGEDPEGLWPATCQGMGGTWE